MLIERIIGRLKGDPNYRWQSTYSVFDLFIILKDRGFQIIRGLILKFTAKKSHGLIFAGKYVKIRHAHMISMGKNIIIGDGTYINALSTEGINLGHNVSIGRNCTLICTGIISHVGNGIIIEDGSGINDNTYLAGQGGIRIGKNVIIGPGSKIFSENHIFSDCSKNIKDQGVSRSGVVINDNCWLGSGVTVLDGVEIGQGCVIAAGSVVSKSMPENSVVAGIPAKVIKTRS